MILRLHHHRDIWQRWKLKAPGPGILLGAWSKRCQLQHWISQPTTETTIASVSQLVKNLN